MLYKKICSQLREEIAQGAPGQVFKTERELMSKFNVSRVTVRKALKILVDDGSLSVNQGAGYVISEKLAQPLSKITSFSDDCKQQRMVPGTLSLDISEKLMPADIALGLGLSIADRAICINRIRTADEFVVCLETSWVPRHLISPQWSGDSLFAEFESLGYSPQRAVQRLKPVHPPEHIAQALEISMHEPIMFVKRITYAQNNTPVEYVESYFRADRWEFVSETHS